MTNFQTVVNRYPDAFGPVGSKYGAGHAPERHFHNAQDEVEGVWTAAVTYAAGESNTLEINGIVTTVAGNTDNGTTRDDLLAALQAETFLAEIATFAANGAASIDITEKTPGAIKAITGSGTSGADVSVSVSTAQVTADAFNAGIILLRDPSNERAVILPNTGSGVVAGLAAHQHLGVDRRSDTQYLYRKGSQVLCGYRGAYIVEPEDTVSPGSDVYYRHTVGANGTQLGALRSDNDGGNAAQLTAAEWLTITTAGGQKAALMLNLP